MTFQLEKDALDASFGFDESGCIYYFAPRWDFKKKFVSVELAARIVSDDLGLSDGMFGEDADSPGDILPYETRLASQTSSRQSILRPDENHSSCAIVRIRIPRQGKRVLYPDRNLRIGDVKQIAVGGIMRQENRSQKLRNRIITILADCKAAAAAGVSPTQTPTGNGNEGEGEYPSFENGALMNTLLGIGVALEEALSETLGLPVAAESTPGSDVVATAASLPDDSSAPNSPSNDAPADAGVDLLLESASRQGRSRGRKKRNKKNTATPPSSSDSSSHVIVESERWVAPRSAGDDADTTLPEDDSLLDRFLLRLSIRQCNKLTISTVLPDASSSAPVVDMRFSQVYLHKPQPDTYYTAYTKLMTDLGQSHAWNHRTTSKEKHLMTEGEMKAHPDTYPKRFTEEPMAAADLAALLRRRDSASCFDGSCFYIFGGSNMKSSGLGDLIRVAKDRVDVFRSLNGFGMHRGVSTYRGAPDRNAYLNLPPMAGHRILAMNGGLLVMGSVSNNRGSHASNYNEGVAAPVPYRRRYRRRNLAAVRPGEMMYYFISNPRTDTPFLGVQYLTQDHVVVRHPARPGIADDPNALPTLIGFTATEFGQGSVYVFGGRRETNRGVFENNVWRLSWQGIKEIAVVRFNLPKDSQRPMGRMHHGAVSIYSNLYVFAGEGQEGHLMNDLWRFDTSAGLWQEIQVSVVPPPMSHFGCFANGTTGFTVVGGRIRTARQRKAEINSNLYSFDFREGCFNVSNVLSSNDDFNCLAVEGIQTTEVAVPSAGGVAEHSTGQIFFGGGTVDGLIGSVIQLDNPSDPGRECGLLRYLEESRRSRLFTDVLFLLQAKEGDPELAFVADIGGDSAFDVPAHLCVLLCRCPKLAEYVIENGDEVMMDSASGQLGSSAAPPQMVRRVTLSAEEDVESFGAFLKWLYTGSVDVSGADNVESFLAVADRWSPESHGPFLRSYASRRSAHYADVSAKIMRQIESDFGSLLGEFAHSTDLTLTFADGESQRVHKLFVVRSPYFRNMLASGFKEATSSEIEFHQFDKECVQEILQYLYTDRLDMSPGNCVGVLIHVLQFEIPVVADFCRRIVEEHVTIDNAVELLSVAELYCDVILKRICSSFIVKNYESVSFDKNYSTIDPETRVAIKKDYERRRARIDKRNAKLRRQQRRQ